MDTIDIKRFNHKIKVPIRFMDLDALQHVNNARYLNFLEEARIAYSQEKLELFNKIEELNVLVARIEIDFMQPIKFGEQLSIYTRICKLGTKSFTFESVFCIGEENERIVSRALQTLVTIDMKLGKSIKIPEDLKLKIRAVEDLTN